MKIGGSSGIRNEVRQEFKAVREETRQEFKAFREETRQEFKEIREETKREIHGLRGGVRRGPRGTKREIQGLREETRADIHGLREEFATVHARIDKLEGAIRELSTQLGTLLERSRGTRRLVWGVLGTLGLLAAGGVLRPVFDRVAAALLAG